MDNIVSPKAKEMQVDPTSQPIEPGATHRSFAIPRAELLEVIRKLWRRKTTIFSSVVLITLLVALVTFQLTPRYSATAKVMIDTQRSRIVNVEEFLSGLGTDAATIQSEIQVIMSRSLAEKVIIRLGLMQNPEFNNNLKEPGLLRSLFNAIFGDGEEFSNAEDLAIQEKVEVVDAFMERLDVKPEGRSRVINITMTTESPKVAADIANVLAELYLLEQLEAKFDATKRATAWLNERVIDLREKVEASERAVEQFRKEAGLIRGKDTTITSQQISEITTQLILARTQRAEAEARLNQIQSLLNSTKGVESVAEVLASPLIQKLREQEAEVARRAAELASEYGVRHPRMINIRAEIQDLRLKIENEVSKIIVGLRNEVGVAKAREMSLEKNLDRLKIEGAELNSAEVQLRALEREAGANRALFDTFLARLKEATGQEEIQEPDARIISKADVPVEASFPKVKLVVVVAFLSSIFIGIGIVFILEQLDTGFRSSEEIENATGIATLGLLPMLTNRQRGELQVEDYVLERPTSSLAEALRTIHTGLLLSDVDDPPKTVLITSSLPSEGKSTLAISLARMLARSGQKIILVDSDLRHPRLHRALGISTQPGLVDILSGKIGLGEAIKVDEKSGLHMITAGAGAPSPTELFNSEQFLTLTDNLKKRYDLVIFDSPPVLVVSDARVIARVVDKTIFVIRWVNTRREVASMAIRQLISARSEFAGVALSMVNVRKHARYGYGDSGHYYGASRKYYAD